MMPASRGVALVVWIAVSCGAATAFWYDKHNWLMDEAFSKTKADSFADRQSAKNSSFRVDLVSNDESSQFKHSMRPAGVSTSEAQRKAQEYIESELRLAVAAAKAGPSHKGEAGKHVGLALHAIQDRKHNWCSCNDSSNPPDSKDPCSSSASGCTGAGRGNHGLSGCGPFTDDKNNFQHKTDRDPTDKQISDTLGRSIDFLNRFVALAR
jgi:hypothetical protein